MRDYELTLLFSPDLTLVNQKKLLTKVKKIITDLEGKAGKTEEWGKKELCYPVQKKPLAYFYCLNVNLPQKALPELNKKLKFEEILRYLLIRRE